MVYRKVLNFKTWLFGLGIGGGAVAIWFLIKLIICTFFGICIL